MRLVIGMACVICLFAGKLIAGQTNLGPQVAGVQLAVAMTNDIISLQGTNWIHCVVINSSSNIAVFPDRFLPARDFSFVVIDRLGTNHALLRRSEGMAGSVGHFSIEPGKRREWIAEIHPDKTLKPGIYQLQVKRPFFADRKQRREVISILKEIELR